MVSNKEIDKELDKIQDNIEKTELAENQEKYKKSAPVFITALKYMLIANIIYTLFVAILPFFIVTIIPQEVIDKSAITTGQFLSQIILPVLIPIVIISLIVNGIMLFGVYKRKRWARYLGIVLFSLQLISNIFYYSLLSLLISIALLVLVLMHKDYLNN